MWKATAPACPGTLPLFFIRGFTPGASGYLIVLAALGPRWRGAARRRDVLAVRVGRLDARDHRRGRVDPVLQGPRAVDVAEHVGEARLDRVRAPGPRARGRPRH